MFEKLSYSIKNIIQKVKAFLTSTEFLRKYYKTRKILKKVVPSIIVYALLICFSYVFVYPILRVFVDSLKTEADLVNPDVVWIPKSIYFRNYVNAGSTLKVFRVLTDGGKFLGIKSTIWNSALYSFINAVLQTVTAGLAGYAFARFNFPGKKFWFAGLIISFVVPTQILIIPRQMLMKDIMKVFSNPAGIFGIKDTNAMNMFNGMFNILQAVPVMIISLLGQGINSAILVFVFYSFFKMIPQALDEAAQIDGANYRQIFYHIILKMSVSTILVSFLFSFIWNWNDTFTITQLMFRTGTDTKYGFESLPEALGIFEYTLSQGSQMSGVADGESRNANNLRGAGIMISILPLILLYALTQRKFVEGIENTGVTGV